MNFFTWINTVARARGDIEGALVHALRADKKLPKGMTRKSFGNYEVVVGFDNLWKRYELFLKRGSQAGQRSRAKTAAKPAAKAVKTKKAA